MKNTCRAAVLRGEEVLRLEKIPLPRPGPDEVLVAGTFAENLVPVRINEIKSRELEVRGSRGDAVRPAMWAPITPWRDGP